jgi:fatty acid synthase subunit alpha, fungi type
VPTENHTFISRHVTDTEIAYCRCQPPFRAWFAARWVGKETGFKPLGISSKGAGVSMKEIEIVPNEAGVPEVTTETQMPQQRRRGISTIRPSLSHSDVSFTFRFLEELF